MREYIDKQGFLSALEKQINYFAVRNRTTEENVVKQIFAFVEAIPADDVRENARGKWIPDAEDLEWGNSLIRYRCSKCKERPIFDNKDYKFILTKFCPNCGADMLRKKK